MKSSHACLNLLYLSPYMDEKIAAIRNNERYIVPSANNKVLGLAGALAKRGHKVRLVSPGWVRGKSGRFFSKVSETTRSGLEVVYAAALDLPGLNILVAIGEMCKTVRRLHAQNPIDVIIFYNYRPELAVPALYAKRILGIPIVLEYEDGYFAEREINPLMRYFINLVERLTAPWLDGAFLVTSLLRRRVLTDNYFVCRGFLNKDLLDLSKGDDKIDRPVLMYSGRFDAERGVHVFLEALERLDIDVRVVITGYGPDRDMVHARCEQLRRQRCLNIEIHDYVEIQQLYRMLKAADVLVNPQLQSSFFSRASFPSKIFEYISAGALIVSSNVSDINEFADNRIVVYSEDTPDTLAKALTKVLTEPERYRSYVENMTEYALRNWSDEAMSEQIDRVVRRAVAGQRVTS